MALKQPFEDSQRESTGSGPDFPGSSGDRERGKFRPSTTPRLTQVAVTGDDGKPVATSTDQLLGEILIFQRAILLALAYTAEGTNFTPEELLVEVS